MSRAVDLRTMRRRIGPVAASLVLHAGLLGAAAWWGVSAARQIPEPDTFVISWIRTSAPPPPEPPSFAPEVEEALEAELTVPGSALEEPELVESAVWSEVSEPLPGPEPGPEQPEPMVVQPLPVDFGSSAPGFELVTMGGGLPGGAGSSREVAAVGAGGAAPGGAAVGAGGASPGGQGRAVEGNGQALSLPAVEPQPIDAPPPEYPRLSTRAGEEGSVLCRLHLSEKGLVTQVDVVESSGFERLDRAAVDMLSRWRFRPRREGGRAVASNVLHRVTFRLSG